MYFSAQNGHCTELSPSPHPPLLDGIMQRTQESQEHSKATTVEVQVWVETDTL